MNFLYLLKTGVDYHSYIYFKTGVEYHSYNTSRSQAGKKQVPNPEKIGVKSPIC